MTCATIQAARLAEEREAARVEAERHVAARQNVLGAAFNQRREDEKRRQREEDAAMRRAAAQAAAAAAAAEVAEAEERRRQERETARDLSRQVAEKRRREAAARAEDRRTAREAAQAARDEQERARRLEEAKRVSQERYKAELEDQMRTQAQLKARREAEALQGDAGGALVGGGGGEATIGVVDLEFKRGLDEQVAQHRRAAAREAAQDREYRHNVGTWSHEGCHMWCWGVRLTGCVHVCTGCRRGRASVPCRAACTAGAAGAASR